MPDYIDDVRSDWSRIRPDLDTASADVVARLARIARIVQVRADALLAEHGMSRDEFDLLSVLIRSSGPLTPTDLAHTLWISGSGTTKRLQKLEATGLITRRAHPGDARAALITPTRRALDLLDPVVLGISSLEESVVASLSREARTQLVDSLRQILLELEPEQKGRGALRERAQGAVPVTE